MRWLFAVLILLFPLSLFGQWPALKDTPTVKATGANDIAIIVAVDDYMLLPDVPGAIDNANEWESFFLNGLKVPTVHVLANKSATREEMLKFAKIAAEDVGEEGTIWWIFIGHGAPTSDGKDGLLIGMDAQQSVDSLNARALKQKELFAALNTDINKTVVIVDACFSGRAPNGKALAVGVQPVIAVTSSAIGKKSVVLSAAKSTEVAGSLEGAARPAFSYLMLGAMRGWADTNADTKVSANEAIQYVRRELRGVKGRQQTPEGSGDLDAILSQGVKEKQPKVVGKNVEPASCPEGQTYRNQKCIKKVIAVAPTGSKADMTLEYLQRRVTFDGSTAFRTNRELEGPNVYYALERPDLAEKWMSHEPWLWIPGIAVAATGIALMVYGIVDGSREWFFGGVAGGFFTMGGGATMITFGFLTESHPLSSSERRSLGESFNKGLREERGLGPEIDQQNPGPKAKGGFWGDATQFLTQPTFNINVRF